METHWQTEGRSVDEETIEKGLSTLGLSPKNLAHAYIKCNLEDQKLSDIGEIGKFEHIQHLNVSKNFLSDLSALGGLRYLKTLDASHNILSDFLRSIDPVPQALLEVNLSDNKISEIQYEDVERFRFLNRVDLSNNEVRSVDALGKLAFLMYLDVSGNAIQDIGAVTQCPLSELIAHSNQIRSMENWNSMRLLRVCDMSNNKLESLEGCEKQIALTTFFFRNNEVESLEEIQRLRTLELLREIDTTENPITRITEYRYRVLFILPGLEIFDNEEVQGEEMIKSGEIHGSFDAYYEGVDNMFLPQGDETTRESLQSYQREREGKEPEMLTEQLFWARLAERGYLMPWEDCLVLSDIEAPLETLDLGSLPVGEAGLYFISQVLKQLSAPSVKQVNLSNALHPDRYSTRISENYGLKTLMNALQKSAVESLDLTGCLLRYDEAAIISGFLESIGSTGCLQKLYLADNELAADQTEDTGLVDEVAIIPSPGLKALSKVLARKSCLRFLDLSSNAIMTLESCKLVAEFISSESCTLQELNLSQNSFTEKGCVVIAEAFRKNRHIVDLNLSECNFSSGLAAKTLGKSVGVHPILKKLNLSDNNLKLSEFVIGLVQSESLEALILQNCKLEPEDWNTLGAALHQRSEDTLEVDEKPLPKLKLRYLDLLKNKEVTPALLENIKVNVETLKCVGSVKASKAFASLIRCDNVKHLTISSPLEEEEVEESDFQEFCENLASNSSLVEFHCQWTHLTQSRIHTLCRSITLMQSITSVTCPEVVKDSTFPDSLLSLKLLSITSFDFSSSTLKSLSISGCELNEAGLKSLIQFLQKHSFVEVLDLSDVSLGCLDEELVAALGRTIGTHPSIKNVNLSFAKLSEVNFEDICGAIQKEARVECLDLRGNPGDKEVLQHIANLVSRNCDNLSTLRFPCILPDEEQDQRFSIVFEKMLHAMSSNSNLMVLDVSDILPGEILPYHRDQLRHFIASSKCSIAWVEGNVSTLLVDTHEDADRNDNSFSALLAKNRLRHQIGSHASE